jgi:hypothetical protein
MKLLFWYSFLGAGYFSAEKFLKLGPSPSVCPSARNTKTGVS